MGIQKVLSIGLCISVHGGGVSCIQTHPKARRPLVLKRRGCQIHQWRYSRLVFVNGQNHLPHVFPLEMFSKLRAWLINSWITHRLALYLGKVSPRHCLSACLSAQLVDEIGDKFHSPERKDNVDRSRQNIHGNLCIKQIFTIHQARHAVILANLFWLWVIILGRV